jgi:hypothetical protein
MVLAYFKIKYLRICRPLEVILSERKVGIEEEMKPEE